MSKWLFSLALAAVITFTLVTRFYNLNWDSGHHLHPDERFLTMVVPVLDFPASFSQYFDTSLSPLNPHNRSYTFYVYGTFPLFFTKLIATPLDLDNYGDLLTLGRFLSALLDTGIVLLVFAITLQITKKKWLALFASFLYACIPTAIQLAHFFAVDTWLVFFLTLSFYVSLQLTDPKIYNLKSKINIRPIVYSLLLGLAFGLALASKVTALLFLPILALSALLQLVRFKKNWLQVTGYWLLVALGAAITFRLTQPYFFSGPGFFNLTPNPKILANWAELKAWEKPENAPPFAYQWIPTKPFVYPAIHLFFWGLGIPLTTMFITSLILTVYLTFKHLIPRYQTRKDSPLFTTRSLGEVWRQGLSFVKQSGFWLSILWILILFVYQGGQFAKALRYFYPLMPFIAVVIATIIGSCISGIRNSAVRILLLVSCLLLPVWYALAFLSVYSRPHTRVAASEWIFQNIPSGSTITAEIWDDGLPLPLAPGQDASRYHSLALPLYDPDSPQKWQPLSQQLAQADYVILTSNRLWRSISALPDKYPVSSRFYTKLFNGTLGFTTAYTATSYPCLIPKPINRTDQLINPTNPAPPPFSIEPTDYCYLALNDDGVEESFTVYDHPKVIILENSAKLSPQELYTRINN